MIVVGARKKPASAAAGVLSFENQKSNQASTRRAVVER